LFEAGQGSSVFLSLRLYRTILTVCTYLLPWAAFELGYRMWLSLATYWGRPIAYPHSGHAGLVLICSFVWAFIAEHHDLASVDELLMERTGARAALSALFATTAALLAILYFSRHDAFPRGLFVCGTVALFVLTLGMRALLRTLFRKRKRQAKPTRILILGADDFAHQCAERLERSSLAPCAIAGYVALPGQNPAEDAVPVYHMEQLAGLSRMHGFEEAILAVHPAEFSRVPAVVESLEKLSLPARILVDLGEGVVARPRTIQLGRLQLLDLTSTPAELVNYALVKRAFDMVFSSFVLLVFAPLLGAIALLIRLTSAGPIFFAQERVGLNGQTFRMYKFRTMRVAAANESDTTWTTADDPRRTRVGEFLRKSSLDELPQFFNVLKGDMSVVGPRPERPYFVEKFLGEVRRYNRRHALKVGITGWAQVCGWRGDTSIEKRVEHDLYYLEHWTLAFDLRILAKTVLSALTSKNAY
jgi:Undecaprenyl-phosphate glucose phosphotransferase